MATTDNLNLYITDDPTVTFQTFRRKMGGTGADSNMKIIDEAITDAIPVTKDFTLSSGSWDTSNRRYTIQDSIFQVTGYAYIVQPATNSVETWRMCGLRAGGVVQTGQIYIYADYSVPSTNITVNVLRMKASAAT